MPESGVFRKMFTQRKVRARPFAAQQPRERKNFTS
jgi:hypothetical protein